MLIFRNTEIRVSKFSLEFSEKVLKILIKCSRYSKEPLFVILEFFQDFGKQIEKFVVGQPSSNIVKTEIQSTKILPEIKEVKHIPDEPSGLIEDRFYKSFFGKFEDSEVHILMILFLQIIQNLSHFLH